MPPPPTPESASSWRVGPSLNKWIEEAGNDVVIVYGFVERLFPMQ